MVDIEGDAVLAVYEIETALPLERAAEVIAGEQSCGTFVRVARETDELRARHAARVRSIEELPPSGLPPLPGVVGDWRSARRGRICVEFPLANFGPSLPNLLAAVAGNLFELREVGALRLVDLELPPAFARAYAGPRFGVQGTRRILDRPQGPLIGTIVKPSIGLTADELGSLVGELAIAGIDFIKDDELQANPPGLPLDLRVRTVTDVLRRVADRTGRMPMYAFNITGDIDDLARNHNLVLEAGGTCVMVCITTVGLAGLEYLSRRTELPIHGHRAGFGAFSRSPQLGIGFTAFQKLARLAGADHLHTNGISNKFYESDEEVLGSISAVRAPLFGGYETLPVLSSGQSPGLAHKTHAATGTVDLLVLAGGGIHGHPDGSAAGVLAMREAWDAALTGESLDDRARRVPALASAVSTFGRA
jgi:ribulose-bisphosphate carboxylase large chain